MTPSRPFTLASLAPLLITLVALPLGACGTTRKAGTCPDRPVVEMCSPGFASRCETDRDGCERCTCVPISDDQGRPVRDY